MDLAGSRLRTARSSRMARSGWSSQVAADRLAYSPMPVTTGPSCAGGRGSSGRSLLQATTLAISGARHHLQGAPRLYLQHLHLQRHYRRSSSSIHCCTVVVSRGLGRNHRPIRWCGIGGTRARLQTPPSKSFADSLSSYWARPREPLWVPTPCSTVQEARCTSLVRAPWRSTLGANVQVGSSSDRRTSISIKPQSPCSCRRLSTRYRSKRLHLAPVQTTIWAIAQRLPPRWAMELSNCS